jgi:hypothetical protein
LLNHGYSLDMYDIVIPVGPNDYAVLLQQLEYTKKNCLGYRSIFIVGAPSVEALVVCDPTVTWIDEGIFPFKLGEMHMYANANVPKRNGWYFQQLIKLYAGSVIPGILERWLVVDVDTFFLKPVEFIRDGKCLYGVGTENWHPYFYHMDRLLGLRRVGPHSGICHHMIFEQKYVQEIFAKVGEPFWRAFMAHVDPNQYSSSGASEYEIYFNYMLTYHADAIQIRSLLWKNVKTLDLDSICHYISWHHYDRGS